MQSFKKLEVWQKAHKLAVDAYELPAYLCDPKGWVLRDQMRELLTHPGNEVSEVRRMLTGLINKAGRWS